MNVEEFVRNTVRRSLAKYLEEHPGGSGGGIGNLFTVDAYYYAQSLGIEQNLSASPDGNPYNYYGYLYPHFIVDRLCDHDTAVSLIRAAILKNLNLGTFNLDVGIQGLVTKIQSRGTTYLVSGGGCTKVQQYVLSESIMRCTDSISRRFVVKDAAIRRVYVQRSR